MHSTVVNPTGMLDKSVFFGSYTDKKGVYFVSETSLTAQSIINHPYSAHPSDLELVSISGKHFIAQQWWMWNSFNDTIKKYEQLD